MHLTEHNSSSIESFLIINVNIALAAAAAAAVGRRPTSKFI